MEKYIEFVKSKLDQRTMLEQLAEECGELTQASMKLIRAAGLNNNPTPLEMVPAYDRLYEEAHDVMALIYLAIGTKSQDIENYEKWERWAKRLGYKEG